MWALPVSTWGLIDKQHLTKGPRFPFDSQMPLLAHANPTPSFGLTGSKVKCFSHWLCTQGPLWAHLEQLGEGDREQRTHRELGPPLLGGNCNVQLSRQKTLVWFWVSHWAHWLLYVPQKEHRARSPIPKEFTDQSSTSNRSFHQQTQPAAAYNLAFQRILMLPLGWRVWSSRSP